MPHILPCVRIELTTTGLQDQLLCHPRGFMINCDVKRYDNKIKKITLRSQCPIGSIASRFILYSSRGELMYHFNLGKTLFQL